jgi:release factor glutamine methyltransferase
VFIPRSETEIVVEHALAALDGMSSPIVIDVGTGRRDRAHDQDERPDAVVLAIDLCRMPRWRSRTRSTRPTSRSRRGSASSPADLRGSVDLR